MLRALLVLPECSREVFTITSGEKTLHCSLGRLAGELLQGKSPLHCSMGGKHCGSHVPGTQALGSDRFQSCQPRGMLRAGTVHCPPPQCTNEGGMGGGLKGGGGRGWLGPPLLPGSPYGPRRRPARIVEA